MLTHRRPFHLARIRVDICAVSALALAKFLDLFLQPLATADFRSLVYSKGQLELDPENPFGFFNLSRLASNIFGV
jgi:hypothetical protein